MNKISKSQFKEAVKQIIRECLEERQVAEIADSKISPLDDITRLVMKRGIKDPQKLDYLITNLYQHQVGKPADPEAVAVAIERNKGMNEASYKVVAPKSATDAKEDKARTIQTEPKVNEASYKVVAPKSYTDAKEDKAKKIPTEPEINEDKWIQKAVNPKHKGYCTPMTKSTCTPARKALAQRFKKGDIHKDNVDETAYKTQGPSAKTFEDSPQLPDAQNDPRNA